MATGIIVPGRRLVTQPQYLAPLDARWKGKVNFVSVTGLPGAQDRVSKQFPASTVLRQATPKGLASYTGSGTNGLVWSGLTPVSNTGNGMAFLMLANPAASGTQGRALFLGNEASSFFNQCDLIFNSDKTGASSSGIFSVTEYDNFFGASAQSIAGQMDGNWHVFIANRPAGDSTWALYRDGINVTDTTTFGTGTAMTAGVRVHCAPTTTAGYTGNAVLAAVLTSLNRGEIAALSDNPWILFQALTRRLWAASGGTAYTQSISGSLTPAGALTKQTGKALSGSSTATGALTKLTSKAFAGSITSAGVLSRSIAKSFAGSITSTGNIVKQTAKAFAGSVTGSGALSTMILFTASFAGSITPSGALSKMTQKALAGNSTLTGAITKLTSKGLSASITLSGALNKLTTKAFVGSITVTGALAEAYQVAKSLAGSITPTGALATAYIAFVAGVLKMLSLLGVGQ
jgi:hypothetical protein